jgi:hypothetical protein
MSTPYTSIPRVGFPPQMTRAIEREAGRAADRVAAFLSASAEEVVVERPRRFPQDALLYLAAGLRMSDWEDAGVTAHRSAGLPAAADVLATAAGALRGSAALDPLLPGRYVKYYADHFSWDASDLFGADVLVGDLDGAEAAEAVARFLWAARQPSAPHTEGRR